MIRPLAKRKDKLLDDVDWLVHFYIDIGIQPDDPQPPPGAHLVAIALLQQKDPDLARVVLYKYKNRMSYDQIAEIMDASSETVRRAAKRASVFLSSPGVKELIQDGLLDAVQAANTAMYQRGYDDGYARNLDKRIAKSEKEQREELKKKRELTADEIPIGNLRGLTARSRAALAKQGIATVGGLIRFTSDDLMSWPDIGISSLFNIKGELRKIGFALKNDPLPRRPITLDQMRAAK